MSASVGEMAAGAMLRAVSDVLEGLPAELAAATRFGMDDFARVDWAYYPREMAGGQAYGLPLKELDSAQERLVIKLVQAGTSPHAFAKISSIRALEPILNALENYRNAELRDSARYWLAVYGEPGETGEWGWRFEGHHVSINYTIRDGQVVASTPLFFGSNPAQVWHGDYPVIRPCGEEEDAGRALMEAFDADQSAAALLNAVAPLDMVIPNIPFVPESAIPGDPPHALTRFQTAHEALEPAIKEDLKLVAAAPSGVAAAAMDTAQMQMLHDLVDVYLTRLPDGLAASERSRLEASGWENVHFAWAGPVEPGALHYYRIHGPSFLVEYDCVQDDGNHIHALWRDPANDFGRDVLREHRAQFH